VIKFEFWPLANSHNQAFDPITVDLTTHVVARG
jgi:hypothetical protein